MNYKLDITESFENDVSAVIDYISHKLYNPAAAERLLKNTEKSYPKFRKIPFFIPYITMKQLLKRGITIP